MDTQAVEKQLQNGQVQQQKRMRVRTSCQWCQKRFKASGVRIHEYYCRQNPRKLDKDVYKPTRRLAKPKKVRSKVSENSSWAKLHIETMVRQFGWRVLTIESDCLIVRVPLE